jgi:hypothetical protein
MLKVNQKNEPPLSQNSLTHVGAFRPPVQKRRMDFRRPPAADLSR